MFLRGDALYWSAIFLFYYKGELKMRNISDGIHWNPYEILPYQRNFNLINSRRSIGKTYGTTFWVLEKCIETHKQFVYVLRTKEERDKKGAFKKSYEKLQNEQYANYEFDWTNETLCVNGELVGWCLCLSETQQIKKTSFPNVNYMIMDEYIIEKDSSSRYISGWREPNLFLNMYHTIDREEDRVKCFLLANNGTFYNPYHIHSAFNVKPVKKGGIWTSENVLFQRPEASEALIKKSRNSKFSRMIAETEYGSFATEGNYIEDTDALIGVHDGQAKYQFTIMVNGLKFGVFNSQKQGLLYISEKVDPSCPWVYALTLEDQSENVLLTKAKTGNMVWFSKTIRLGLIRYESMLIKKICEKAIYNLA